MFGRFGIEEDDHKPGVVPGAEDEDPQMPIMLAYLSVPSTVVSIVLAATNDEATAAGEAPIVISAFACDHLFIAGQPCLSKIQGAPLHVMRMIGALAAYGHDCLLSAER